ncbi:hypothetical protein Aph01nite_37480 [Acrocarpospora phusangensis]|uniref:DUF4307 domain-containing protein n=1 Tax=Acrocarpospora phusangensis TaxID=1070424 RepID=A0A919QDG8_9ACTN|nr:DUF4307 domain-containing protein [Acrocarpospora phusangensis]GIH25438.1 hypothetical protein Aph01nite_37480 [Acrocarpospora phusangensis]
MSPEPVTRPVLGTPADFPERPPAGRSRFLVYALIGVVVAVLASGWGYVILSARGNPEVRAEVVAFDASAPDSAAITFLVHKPADREARCLVRALDTHHVEVGTREVAIPRGESDTSFTERVKTSAQATAVHVQYCNLV